jgi:hypothetical protein
MTVQTLLHVLNKTDLVYKYIQRSQTVFGFFNSSGIFRMLLQRVWQTAYNRIFRVQQTIVRIYFHAYNRIRVGEGFPVL